MTPALLPYLALAVAGIALVVGIVLWRRGGEGGAAVTRIDRLEATLREIIASNSQVATAQMREGFEGKHRELSDSLSRTLEERTQRIETTVRALKEANQEQLLRQERELRALTEQKLAEVRTAIEQLKGNTAQTLGDLREGLSKRLLESLSEGSHRTLTSLQETMKLATDTLNQRFAELQGVTDQKLTEISGKVTERLDEGFKQTNETFTQVVTRLAIIDKAQQEIADLSREVVSLQDILSDKKARGVFGEVQLNQLVINTLPEGSYALQHDLGNGTRADCVLFLPEPTGTMAIDAKFPLENYRRMFDAELSEAERGAATRQFKLDIRAHVQAISSKYIIPGTTADGAVMFVPAEAIFAELHAHHPDLVEEAQRKRVWITSPTTMMAVLTTARAVLKDAQTRQQVHLIQDHLQKLAKDFQRFRERMEQLARHIRMASKDVDEVGISADKIASRFEKIEQVQLEAPPTAEPKTMEQGGS